MYPPKLTHSLPVFLFLLLPFFVSAQKDFDDTDQENFFRVGFKAGTNVNKLPGKSLGKGFAFNYQAGVFVQFNFSKRFGIQPEVNIAQATAEVSNDATSIFDDLFRGGGQKEARFNYMEVPILLNVNIGESKHVKLQVGPSYSFLIKPMGTVKTGSTSLYKNGEFSAIGGLWLQLPFVHLGARYKMGFNSVTNTITNEKWKNQAVQIFLGVTF